MSVRNSFLSDQWMIFISFSLEDEAARQDFVYQSLFIY
jgi:hypothetical protein